MSRIVRFDSKIIAGKLVKVPVYENGNNNYRSVGSRQRPNEFNTAAGRSSLGLYGASQAFPGSHSNYAKYDDYGTSLNYRSTPREEVTTPQSSKTDFIKSQRAEAENNRIKALNQTFRSVLSPEPQTKPNVSRPISSDPLAFDVAMGLMAFSRAKILRINGKMQKLDPSGSGLLYPEDIVNILNVHDVEIKEETMNELLNRHKASNGKIYYGDVWQFLSDCHMKREMLNRKKRTTSFNLLQSKTKDRSKSKEPRPDARSKRKASRDLDDDLKAALEKELKDNARKTQVPLDLRPLQNSLRNCDRGKTGIMGKNEVQVLSQHYLPISNTLLERLMAHYDPSNSGWINYEKMLDILEETNPIFLPQLSSGSSKVGYNRENSLTTKHASNVKRRGTFVVSEMEKLEEVNEKGNKSQKPSRRKKWNEPSDSNLLKSSADVDDKGSQMSRKKWELKSPVTNIKGTNHLYQVASQDDDTDDITILLNGKEHILYRPDELDIGPVYRKQPDKKLKLKRIHGYSGSETHNSMRCLASGEVVYIAGIFVVIWNGTSKIQRHYKEHTGRVTCITVHPNGTIVASGQSEGTEEDSKPKAEIRVWNSYSLETIAVVGENSFHNNITGLSFSHKFNADRGFYLFACDNSKDPILSVWNWRSNEIVAQAKVPTARVLGIDCSPVKDEVVVYGREYIARWRMDENKKLSSDKLRFLEKPIPRFITTVLHYASGTLIAGDSNGFIHIWNRDSKKADHIIRNAHEGSVSSLTLFSDVLLSAGKQDLKIHAWNDQYEPTGVDITVRKSYLGCKCISANSTTLFVGTSSNAVLQTNVGGESLSVSSSRELLNPISEGHGDSIVGICCHPFESRMITAAADGSVNSYSTPEDVLNWKITVQGNASGLTVHPSGNIVVVSCFDGSVYILDGNTGQVIKKTKATTSGIHVLEFSPDTSLLAAGTHEGKVYIFKYDKRTHELDPIGIGKGLSAPINALDWSMDNKHIRAQSSAADIISWHVPDMVIKSQFDMRNERWMSYNCSLDYMVAGLWTESKFNNPETAYTVTVSRSHGLTARGDFQGNIRVYTFPAPKAKAPFLSKHSSANSVKFLRISPDGQTILAVASEEGIIYEWTIY